MKKRLALLDFDNVIYKGHSVFDIIQAQERDGFMKPGVWNAVEGQLQRYKNKEATYKEAADKMLKAWAEGLRGKSYQEAVDYVQTYFDNNPNKFFGWFEAARPLLSQHHIFIVSTNYQFISEAVVSRFNLQGFVSSEAEVKDDRFTGRVAKSLAGNKGEVVGLLERYPKEGTIAVGDSENDIEMLEKVEIPICFNPDERLRGVANNKGWPVVNESTIVDVLKSKIS
jgi:HAD superfamily phosphoserine phosphatase-like hydrolase